MIAASSAFPFCVQNDQAAGVEANYTHVDGFSGYLTLDNDPLEKVREWLDPVEIESLSAMPKMKRDKTMGAFVELRGCKQNTRGVCNVRVDYTIYKPHGSLFVVRAVRQREIIWKKRPSSAQRTSSTKTRNQGGGMEPGILNPSKGLARMHFRLGRNDPKGMYKVKAKVADINADISFELELDFDLK
jgi:hypothetical protein